MLKAIDIANFFIDVSDFMDEESITNMKVNKLVYFAQAWSLVKFNKKLFNEDIEAWKQGPVIPSVYKAFRTCESKNIEMTIGDYDESIFTAEQLNFLADIALTYGKYTALALRNISDKPGSPWALVYEKKKNNIISPESMTKYFSALPELPDYKAATQKTIGYRDDEGYLVLPKDWNDENE